MEKTAQDGKLELELGMSVISRPRQASDRLAYQYRVLSLSNVLVASDEAKGRQAV
jgi:hypothetical protein